MTRYVLRLITASTIVAGAGTSVAMAQPPVPSTLEVPAGHVLFFQAHATGTQNYVCLPAANPLGVAWTFIAPEATLFFTFDDAPVQQVATHFLSPNVDPLELGRPRPTWQHSIDSSRVWARAIASSTDAAFVEPGAIPWLLLEKAGTQLGPLGGFFLAQTAYIQRLNTSGGIAPATGCSQPSNIGALALVPYETDYFFYKVRRAK